MRREKILLHYIQSGIPVFPDRFQPGIPYGSDHLLRCALVGNLKLLRRLAIPFSVIGKIHRLPRTVKWAAAVPTPV